MKSKINVVFVLFLIMGFQLQYPVTMFPANTDIGDIVEDMLFTGFTGSVDSNTSVIKNTTVTQSNTLGDALARRHSENIKTSGEHFDFNKQNNDIKPANKPIELATLEITSMNGGLNQARPSDRRDFNGKGGSFKGFTPGLNTNKNEIRKSGENRIKEDLSGIVFKQSHNKIEKRLTNVKTRTNILKVNNDDKIAKGHQLAIDGGDSIDNTRVIKSRQSQSTQVTTGKSHSTSDNKSQQQTKNTKYVNGMVWSPEIIEKCRNGIKHDKLPSWKRIVSQLQVVKVETGCGSMQNRLITFNDSTKACVRYRLNDDQMQGEMYSYYLSRLLDMEYIPSTTLTTVDTEQWQPVNHDIKTAKWPSDKPVIVTKWLNSLEPVYMPNKLKDIKSKLHRENNQLTAMTPGEICELVQWSDLIVFDYISANLDRVVNNMFNLKWNPGMLEKPIHNLEKKRTDGQFVLIDNESGLFHGYRLLDTYEPYHEQLLHSVCVFNPSTVDAIEKLYLSGKAGDILQQLYEKHEHLHSMLPSMGTKNKQTLQQRVQTVYKHMQMCQHNGIKT